MKHYILSSCGLIVVPAILALAACTTATPEKVLESHGKSVRNMIAEQTYTEEDEAEGIDGQKSLEILEAYRHDTSDPKKVEEKVINIKFD